MKKKIAVYVRSTSQSQQSIAKQKDAIYEFIRNKYPYTPLEHVSVYSDCGYCSEQLDRPALLDLRADIKAGMYTVVVVESANRLTRNPDYYTRLLYAWDASGISLELVNLDSDQEDESSSNQLVERILSTIAISEYDSLKQKRRTSRSNNPRNE